MYQTLKKLVSTLSVSGREKNLANIIKAEIEPFVDSIRIDAMNNLIAFKKGSSKNAKKLMFASHMDEIGFIVTFIEDNGFIRFAPVGGINFTACAFSSVVFENGRCGVLAVEAGTKPEDIKFDKCYVDIGASSKKEAERLVKIGDVFAVQPSVKKLAGSRIAGRPFDDKICCAVLIDAVKKIRSCENDIYFVFTVQEEVGLRGSKTAAFSILPDYGIALDVCPVGDTIGAKQPAVKLGDGAAIKIKDSSVICDIELVSALEAVAKGNKIKYQREILTYGGTDTASMQMAGAGCRATCISIPTRYIHSAVETADLKDCEEASKLVVAIAESLIEL